MSNSTGPQVHPYLPNLDGLRGLASLMVLTFHLSLWIEGSPYFPKFRVVSENLSRGVQLFFVLSAFTLFHTANSRWQSSNHPVFAFYIRRIFRIFPLWWIAIAIECYGRAEAVSAKSIFSTAFFTFGLSQDWFSLLLISVGWTLFVEETFYVLFPIWRILLRTWVRAALMVAVATLVCQFLLRTQYYWLDSSARDFLAKSPATNYFAFFIGILLERLRYTPIFQWFCSSAAAPKAILNLVSGCSFILIFFTGRVAGTFLFLPLIMASFNTETFCGLLMRSRFMVAIGKCCYSIYLFHTLVGMYIVLKAKDYLWPALDLTQLPAEAKLLILLPPISLACLGVGLFSYKYIERPCISLGKILVGRLGARET